MDYIEAFVIVPIALVAFWLIFKYARWEDFDDRRRSDRMCKRNLDRAMGR